MFVKRQRFLKLPEEPNKQRQSSRAAFPEPLSTPRTLRIFQIFRRNLGRRPGNDVTYLALRSSGCLLCSRFSMEAARRAIFVALFRSLRAHLELPLLSSSNLAKVGLAAACFSSPFTSNLFAYIKTKGLGLPHNVFAMNSIQSYDIMLAD